ncbi:hypothetical protein [Hydrogenothermus marinus]|uniref:LTXXQ motif family protein n=1 Tax=Hydrogenothermus marinus TaxID=133270 RepID=A0A3M0B7G6_9AQUI|nr:hypothetical protein [Hydrogenothermus marinus]RMA93333.1 hypothetical protein CLV39_1399 [Hydrogenothermus marinus]
MERRKILSLILIFTFFFSSIKAQENKNCDSYLASYPDIIKVVLDNKDNLDLSQEQMESIESAISTYEPMILERKKQINQLQEKLNKLILEGGKSEDIKQIILKLAQLKAENLVLKIKEIREVQNSLTESQYKKILSLIEAKKI